jgi:hypothetical protein
MSEPWDGGFVGDEVCGDCGYPLDECTCDEDEDEDEDELEGE